MWQVKGAAAPDDSTITSTLACRACGSTSAPEFAYCEEPYPEKSRRGIALDVFLGRAAWLALAREGWREPEDQRPRHRASRAPQPPPRLSFVARHRSRQVRLYVGQRERIR